MAAICILRYRNVLQRVLFPQITQSVANYAAPKKVGKLGKLGPVAVKKEIPVETDPEKLVNYVCGSNYLKEGEDVKLKDDKEYPDWLWELPTGKPIDVNEMDPNTLEYWERVRKLARRRNRRLLSVRKF